MRKAQISLEMIIMLVVLLVLAGVVISLILYFLNPKIFPSPGKTLEKRDFISKCEEFCRNTQTLDYCTYYYEGDWNDNGIKHEIVKVGKHEWYTCEDRIYCFLVVPCEERFGSGLDALRRCKLQLCQVYLEKHGNINRATQSLLSSINFPEICDVTQIPSEENWYERIFKSGCTRVTPGGITTTTTTSPTGQPPTTTTLSPPPSPPP